MTSPGGLDARALARLVEGAPPERLAAAFDGLDEAARRALRPAVMDLYRAVHRGDPLPESGVAARVRRVLAGPRLPRRLEPMSNAALAVLACGGLAEVRRVRFYGGPAVHPALLHIIRERRPDWVQEWVEHCLSAQDWPLLNWDAVRALMAAGLCVRPQAPAYARLMTNAYNRWQWQRPETYVPLSQSLAAAPDLLEDEIWRLFQVETEAFSFDWATRNPKRPPNYEGWPEALIKLAQRGSLDRQRLLDESLAAPWRVDNGPFQAAQCAFHRALEPTDAERIARADRYLELVGHRNGAVAGFALTQVAWLIKTGALTPGAVIRVLPPVFTLRSKAQPLAALRVLKQGLADGEAPPASVLAVLRAALTHGHVEVQAEALALVDALASQDPAYRALRTAHLEDLAPSLRAAEAPAGEAEEGAGEVRTVDEATLARVAALPEATRRRLGLAELPTDGFQDLPPPLLFRTWEVPQLAALAPVPPIASVSELIDAAARALEEVHGAGEVERLLEGLSRLCAQRPEDFGPRTAPLLKRLERAGRSEVSHGLVGFGAPPGFLDVLLAWLAGVFRGGPQSPFMRLVGPVRLQQARLVELAQRVARRQAAPLLAAPTHAGGWVRAEALVGRVRTTLALGIEPLPMDGLVALMRLAPDDRAPALAAASDLPGHYGRALRYALGGTEGPTPADRCHAPLWVTAARARDPGADQRPSLAPLRLGVDWPDLARPAEYEWESLARTVTVRGRTVSLPQLTIRTRPSLPGGSVEAAEALTPRPAGGLARAAQGVGSGARCWVRGVRAVLERALEIARTGQIGHLAAFPPVLMHERSRRNWRSLGLGAGWQVECVSWLAPLQGDPVMAWGVSLLSDRIDATTSSSEPNHPFLYPLLEPDRAWTELGMLALWIGLASRDRDARGVAVDALVAGLEDGRAHPLPLAQVLGRLRVGGWLKIKRVADALQEAARPSALHRLGVCRLLEQHLLTRPALGSDDLPLLALLNELLAELERPVVAPLQERLGALSGKGKTARLGQALLSRTPAGPGTASAEAVRAALLARLDRAARWAGEAQAVP